MLILQFVLSNVTFCIMGVPAMISLYHGDDVDNLLKFHMGPRIFRAFSVFFPLLSLLVVGGRLVVPPIFLSTKQGQKIYIHDVLCFIQNI